VSVRCELNEKNEKQKDDLRKKRMLKEEKKENTLALRPA
jgi:hypothetical protein